MFVSFLQTSAGDERECWPDAQCVGVNGGRSLTEGQSGWAICGDPFWVSLGLLFFLMDQTYLFIYLDCSDSSLSCEKVEVILFYFILFYFN